MKCLFDIKFYKKTSLILLEAILVANIFFIVNIQNTNAVTVTLIPSMVGNYDTWVTDAKTKTIAVTENDGDTSYIESDDSGDSQTFVVAGASVPKGSVINSVTLNVVAKRGKEGALILASG